MYGHPKFATLLCVCLHGCFGQTHPHCRAKEWWWSGLRSVPTATPTSSRTAVTSRGTSGPTKVCYSSAFTHTNALRLCGQTSVPVSVNIQYFSAQLTYDLSLHLSSPHPGCPPKGWTRLKTGCRRCEKKLASWSSYSGRFMKTQAGNCNTYAAGIFSKMRNLEIWQWGLAQGNMLFLFLKGWLSSAMISGPSQNVWNFN